MQDLTLFHRRCVHKVSVAIFVYMCAYIHIYVYICTYTGGAQRVSIDARSHIISLARCRECECHNIYKYLRLYIYIRTYTGGARRVSIDARSHIISPARCRECECHDHH